MGSGRQVVRPRLIQKMMGERAVARFLVAPAGFGKTSLALQYAEEIVGLSHVWWMDAEDPCFLRDLDNGRIRASVLGMSAQGDLAVFEDVPYLDDERSRAFSQVIDDMLERGWEVVVTTIPLYDSFSERQADRVLIGAFDFLLDDAELAGSCRLDPGDIARPSERIGAVVWGDQWGMESFLCGMGVEEMPADMQLALFVMLALQDGLLEEMAMFVRTLKQDVRTFIAVSFPYAGIDPIEEQFSACRLSVGQLMEAFGSKLDRMAAASSMASKDVLIMRLAGELVHKGNHARACELISAACGRRRRSVWLEEHQDALLASASLLEAEGVLASLGDHPVKLKPSVLLHAALRSALLGDRERASGLAARVLGQAGAGDAQRVESALICMLDAGSRHAQRGRDALAAKDTHAVEATGDADAAVAALACAAAAGDASRMAEVVRRSPRALSRSAAGSYVLSALLSVGGSLVSDAAFANAACTVLEMRAAATKEPDLAEALLFSSVAAASTVLPSARVPLLSASRIKSIDSLLGRLTAQRRRRGEGRTETVFCADDRGCASEQASSPHLIVPETPHLIVPGSAAAADRACTSAAFVSESIPPLYVRLFGGMEVWLGDRQLDPRVFTKQKAKTLLAVLILHGAQEVPRRRVMDIMWPTLVGDSAINNFYSMWSVLRRALALENGSCPYLVKQQASCMLDRRYVASDVDRFDEFCRKLLFEKPDAAEWSEIHLAMSRMYAGDLLPSEMKNEYIMAMRTQFRNRLVDALVAAGNGLLDEGEPQVALWFIRSAADHDDGREDVYRTLIRAQIMSGQRAAAIESYLHCRKILKDRYGMEVSRETQALYDSLVLSGV